MLVFFKKNCDVLLKSDWPVLIGLLYILFANMPHTVAAQYLLSGLMLLSLVAKVFKGDFRLRTCSSIDLWFYAMVAVCLVSTCLSPYFSESFSQIKKDAIPYLVAFVLFVSHSGNSENRERLALRVLQATVLAFVFRSALAAWDFAVNGFNANIYESGRLPKYLDYYAIDAVLYVPIVMGMLFFVRLGRCLKICLAASLVVALAIVFVSQIRTSFVLCSFTVGSLLLWRFWETICRQRIFVAVILAAVLGGAFALRDTQSIVRYKTIFDYQGYVDKSKAMSGRYPIWLATLEVVATRPIIGYGEGWKKLPLVAEETGLLQKWSQSKDPLFRQAAEYMKLGPGVVNPHNLYLLVLFEVGSLGLLVFLGLIGAMLASIATIIKSCKGNVRTFRYSVAVISMFYIADYILLGVTNATWFTGSFLAVMASLSLLSTNKKEVNLC